MKTKLKKMLAALLSVTMLASMLPAAAMAEGATPLPTAVVSQPTPEPIQQPAAEPAVQPSAEPTEQPISEPMEELASEPVPVPTPEPTVEPVLEPTPEPTEEPVLDATPESAALPALEAVPLAAGAYTVESYYGDSTPNYTFTKLWNDNNEDALRPGKEASDQDALTQACLDFYSESISIYYALAPNGEPAPTEGYVALTAAEASRLFGLEAVPTPSTVSYNFNRMAFTFETEKLPCLVTADGREYQVYYGFSETTPWQGYAIDTACKNDGSETALTNTLLTDYTADIKWWDNGGVYNTRIEAQEYTGKLTLYRDAPTGGVNGEVVADALQLDATGDTWQLYAAALPAFDSEGNRYTYYAQYQSQGNLNQFPAADFDTQGNAYQYQYQNEGTQATDTTRLYQNGVLENTLVNELEFTAYKRWEDGDTDPASRPNAVLHLYRVTEETGADGSFTFEPELGSPVQHFDSAAVPTAFTDDNRAVWSGDGEDAIAIPFIWTAQPDARLPMYDATGTRYVYYAIERGLTGDYQAVITNTDTIHTAVDENGVPTNQTNLLLNGGLIENRLEQFVTLPVTKQFNAGALQSLDPETTSVTFHLLRRLADNANSEWEPALDADGVQKSVTMTDCFRPETMGYTDTSTQMPQYSKQGYRYEYRWVETAIQVNGAKTTAPGYAGDSFSGTGEQLFGFTPAESGNADVPVQAPGSNTETGATEVAPGVGEAHTTAVFSPAYHALGGGNYDYSVIENTLVGNTELEIVKTWYDETGNVTSQITQGKAVFDLLQNGTKIADITLTDADLDTAANVWRATRVLPRYDEDGNEYVYTINENLATVTAGSHAGEAWGWDEPRYSKDVVLLDKDGSKQWITRLTAEVDNHIGPGEDLRFEVDKTWLDGDDLLTRRPVTVALYQNGSTAPVETAVLNEANQWHHVFVVARPTGKTVNDYFVKEVKVGEAEVAYATADDRLNAAADAFAAKIGNTGKTWFAGQTTEATKPDAIGSIAADAHTADGLMQRYNLYATRTTRQEDTRAAYVFYNQRYANLTLEFTKEWVAGNQKLECGFGLLRGDQEVDSFTLGDAANPALTEIKTLENLPKYDAAGVLYYYTVVEKTIGNGIVVQDNRATVNGDTYVISLAQKSADYSADHRDGDVYTWVGRNVRQGSYLLTVNKLWQDDGTAINRTARPDVVFALYRTTAASILGDGASGSDEKALTDQAVAKLGAMTPADAVAVGAKVISDREWNTQYNDWNWECNLGTVPRYDENGSPYIYYLLETVRGNAGDYGTTYYNGNCDIENYQPSQDASCVHTEAVFPYAHNTTPEFGSVLVVADGVNANAKAAAVPDTDKGNAYNTYYSGTTVNYRTRDLTIRGEKVWRLPGGYSLPSSELPEVNFHIYRSSTELGQGQTGYAALEGNANVEKVSTAYANVANRFAFSCTADTAGDPLNYYDSFGREYYYYVAEEPILGYPDLQATANSYVITNTYAPVAPYVEIAVNKTWSADENLSAGAAEAVFTLYAQCSTDGTAGGVVGSRMQLATGTLVGTTGTRLVFTHYTNTAGQKLEQQLPYYGPNGKPLVYTVEETVPHGYQAQVTPQTTNVITMLLHTFTGSNTAQGGHKLSSGAVALTKSDDALYKGTVSYTNTYNGKSDSGEIGVSVQKKWAGDTDWQNFRPEDITVKLNRTFSDGTADTSFNEQTITLSDTIGWKHTFEGLLKYAPDGTAYKYVFTESAGTNTALYNLYDHSTATVEGVNTATLTNTFKTTNLTATKTWQTGSDMVTWAEFQRLYKLGALPQAVAFKVQRLEEGVWKDLSNHNGKSIQNSFNIAGTGNNAFTQAQFNAMANQVFVNLPKYWDGENPEALQEIQYRVVEVITWAAGSETVVTPDGVTGTVTGARPGCDSTVAVAGGSYKFTNAIPVGSIQLTKQWAGDENNRDGARPKTITVKLYRDPQDPDNLTEDDYVTTVALKPGSGYDDAQSWPTVTVNNLPLYKNGADTVLSTYYAVETAFASTGKQYTTAYKLGSNDDPLNSTNADQTEPETIIITNTASTAATRFTATAAKAWAGDDSWQTVTRPDSVYLTLQYQNGNEWVNVKKVTSFDGDNSSVYTTSDPTQQITAADSWAGAEWQNLPAYHVVSGQSALVQYRVAETSADGSALQEDGGSLSYTVTNDGARQFNYQSDSKSVTLTNTLANTLPVAVTKAWEGMDNALITKLVEEGSLPAELIFAVQYQLQGQNDWTLAAEFTLKTTDLLGGAAALGSYPKFDRDGNTIAYRVRELKAQYGTAQPLEIADTNLGEPNYTSATAVTNTFALGSLTVNKQWADNANRDGQRPSDVTLRILRDGSEYATCTLNAANNWQQTVANLPVYKIGGSTEKSVYTIEEVSVPTGYTAAYSYSGSSGGVTLDGITPAATATNSRNVDTFTITAQKAWEDAENINQTRPAAVELTLQYSTDGSNWQPVPTTAPADADPVTPHTRANPQTISAPFTDSVHWTVQSNYNNGTASLLQYRVVESDVASYTAAVAPATVTAQTATAVTVTNTLLSTSLQVQKAWQDSEDAYRPADSTRPQSITVQLQRSTDGENWENVTVNGAATLTKEQGWQAYTFANLPVYADAANNTPCQYRAIEIKITYPDPVGEVAVNGEAVGSYTVSAQTDDAVTTLTNTLQTTTFTAAKTWVDGNNRDSVRPQSITLQLQRDGVDFGSSVTVTAANNWQHQWQNLPLKKNDGSADSVYTVVETPISGYSTAINGSAVTNTHDPLHFAIEGKKVWLDENNYSQRPAEAKLKLQCSTDGASWGDVAHLDAIPAPAVDDGATVYTTSAVEQTVAAPGWSNARWENLPAYSAGKLVYYKVVEVDTHPSYQATRSNEVQYDPQNPTVTPELTVTNTLTGTVSLTVNKQWPTQNWNTLPDSVQVVLQSAEKGSGVWTDVAQNGTANLTAANGWSTSFGGLLNSLEYRAVERSLTYGDKVVNAETSDGIKGTVGSYQFNAITVRGGIVYKTTLTNTLPDTSLSVQKLWEDDADRDALRPNTVTVQLYRDGDAVGNPIVLDAATDWKGSWLNLPLYKNGSDSEKSVYHLEEVSVPNEYTPDYTKVTDITLAAGETSRTFTNTHTPHSFTLTAQKEWEDAENTNQTRPQALTFTLQYSIDGTSWADVPQTNNGDGVTPYTDQTSKTLRAPAFAPVSWVLPCNYNTGVTGSQGTLQYRVVESDVASYSATTPQTGSNADGAAQTVTVTNTLLATALNVVKIWDGDSADAYATRPTAITAKLQRSTDGVAWQDVAVNGTLTLSAADNWAPKTFANLPQYADAANNQQYFYRAVETELVYGAGLLAHRVAVAYPDNDPNRQGSAGGYNVTAHTLSNGVVRETVLQNTLQTTALAADKRWAQDMDNAHATRPQSSLTVKLQRRTTAAGLLSKLTAWLSGSSGWQDVAKNAATATAELVYDAAAATWGTAHFTALPAADRDGNLYEYRAVEVSEVPGYVSSTENDQSGHTTITNTLQLVSLAGSKAWQDYSNAYAARPAGITLSVANQSGTLAAQPQFSWTQNGDTWQYSTTELPKYLPGTNTEAVYTLTEAATANYRAQNASVTAQNNKADFVNALVMPTTSVTITKHSQVLGTGAKLQGCGYILCRQGEDGATQYYTGTVDGYATWSTARDAAQRIVTGPDGSATVQGLPYGDYWFIEVAPPAGHEIDTKPIPFRLDATNMDAEHAVAQADPLTPVYDGDDAAKPTAAPAAVIPATADQSHPAAAAAAMVLSGLALAGLALIRKKRCNLKR